MHLQEFLPNRNIFAFNNMKNSSKNRALKFVLNHKNLNEHHLNNISKNHYAVDILMRIFQK